ncbi:hypothetical protein VZT92_017653 [Zoarces viviparus]
MKSIDGGIAVLRVPECVRKDARGDDFEVSRTWNTAGRPPLANKLLCFHSIQRHQHELSTQLQFKFPPAFVNLAFFRTPKLRVVAGIVRRDKDVDARSKPAEGKKKTALHLAAIVNRSVA